MASAKSRITPRQLLARVRDVMAGAGAGQDRLDRMVSLIADGMGAEVCSVYIRRAGDLLELFATEGLKKTAVHQTRLRVGEGLVGVIAARARPLALSDAQHHPAFVFRPETGEEIYHSLMGVPVLRGGRVLGVLVAQNRMRRRYLAEEIEILQTIAMVLAEMIAGGELVGGEELWPADGIAVAPLQISVARFHGGMGMGLAVLARPQVQVSRLVAEDIEEEHTHLRQAVTEMHGALDALLKDETLVNGGEHRGILESYRMIAEDAGWLGRIGEAIDGGLTAEAAVLKVQNDIRARLSQVSDRYLRERVHDLDDLAQRLLKHLVGEDEANLPMPQPDDVVLFARNLGPAQLLEFDRSRLRAVVLEEGSPMAHVAIIARALDIPMVGQAKGVLGRVEEGDPVIVDANHGSVLIRPGDNVRQSYRDSIAEHDRQKATYAALHDLPAVTRDGARVEIHINAGLRIDIPQIAETGADGVGLYRTEIPFMVRHEFPDVDTQTAIYREIVELAGDKPVIFRTLDVGGDKILPYWGDNSAGDNPAMGWRAIRICLDRPAILRHQLRALIRASHDRDLRLMFPMIAEIAEFDAAHRLLDMELHRMRKQGQPMPKTISVGAMLEVPSLIFQLSGMLKRADFLSIGSNDLMQFLFASDRGNSRLADRYDPVAPSVLRMLRDVVRQCDAAGVPVSLCGEMAGNPLDAMALVGLGFRRLSMSPSSVGRVKAMIRSLTVGSLESYMDGLFDAPDHSVREKLRAFAQDHGVMI